MKACIHCLVFEHIQKQPPGTYTAGEIVTAAFGVIRDIWAECPEDQKAAMLENMAHYFAAVVNGDGQSLATVSLAKVPVHRGTETKQ